MAYLKTSVLETKKEGEGASEGREETVGCSSVLYLLFFTLLL